MQENNIFSFYRFWLNSFLGYTNLPHFEVGCELYGTRGGAIDRSASPRGVRELNASWLQVGRENAAPFPYSHFAANPPIQEWDFVPA
jgi:hypothetical protein